MVCVDIYFEILNETNVYKYFIKPETITLRMF